MKYTLGFKSGNCVEINVNDGEKFINNVLEGVKKNLSAPIQWYLESGYIFVISELEFVTPSETVMPNKQKE